MGIRGGTFEMYFSVGAKVELFKTVFVNGNDQKSVMLRYGFSDMYGPKANAFKWSHAVVALAYFFTRICAWAHCRPTPMVPEEPPSLGGRRGSIAASINDAMTKRTPWIASMFGSDDEGRPFVDFVIERINRDFKSAESEPVTIKLITKELSPFDIKIFVGDREVVDPNFLALIADRLEKYYNPETPGPAVRAEVASRATRGVLRIADCNLVVVKSILLAWGLEDIMDKFNIDCIYLPFQWSDKILNSIVAGEVDIAIYNTKRTEAFIDRHDGCPIEILMSIGASMGGKNFYVLTDALTKVEISNKVRFLDSASGFKVVAPINSDILENFLLTLEVDVEDLDNHGITVVDIPISAGLDVFKFSKDIFFLSGQNARFQAGYRGGYKEILTADSLSFERQTFLAARSMNSLIVRRSVFETLSASILKNLIHEATGRFFTTWRAQDGYNRLVERMTDLLEHQCDSRDECRYMIKKILFMTYRFGFE